MFQMIAIETASPLALNIHGCKTKILQINAVNNDPVTLDESDLEEVDLHLPRQYIRQAGWHKRWARIGKARTAYLQNKNI